MRLDTGWIDQPSMLVLKNQPEQRTKYPTAEERAEEAERVIEVCFGIMGVQVIPMVDIYVGQDCRFKPTTDVYLRCKKGTAKCLVTAYPR